MLRQQNYPDYFQGCLVGLAIGDAIGMPVETMTHEEIQQLHDGAGITGPVRQISMRYNDGDPMEAGTTTDDTQLAFALALSLIEKEGLDLFDVAMEIVAEYRSGKFGWGGTLRSSAEALGAYLDSNGKTGRSPLHYLTKIPSFDPKAHCGNGVAMRIAPFGLWHGTLSNRVDDLVDRVFMIGRMTHDDPRASIAAVAITAAVSHLLYHGHSTGGNDWFFRKSVMDAVRHAEEKFVAGRKVFSDRLEHAYALTGSTKMLREEIGCGSFALESVPFAIGTFLRHPSDFRAGVLEAVNAGGDADTTASMVGAMIGTNVGISGVPRDWVMNVRACHDAVLLANSLHEMCIRTAQPRS